MPAGDLCPGGPPTRGRGVFPWREISELFVEQLPVAGLLTFQVFPIRQGPPGQPGSWELDDREDQVTMFGRYSTLVHHYPHICASHELEYVEALIALSTYAFHCELTSQISNVHSATSVVTMCLTTLAFSTEE